MTRLNSYSNSALQCAFTPLLVIAILCLAALTGISPAQALPGDRNQPINIDADRAVRNEKAGITQFIGNATMTQGSLVIEAEDITITHADEGISSIVALGSPATLKQKPDDQRQPVTAKAQRIEYRPGSEIVNLVNDASIDQNGSIFTSDTIHYDIRRSLAETGGEGRVNIVIQPNRAESSNSEPVTETED